MTNVSKVIKFASIYQSLAGYKPIGTDSLATLRNALGAIDYSEALNEALNSPGAYGNTLKPGETYSTNVIVQPGLTGIDYQVTGPNPKGAEIFRRSFVKNLSNAHLQAIRQAQFDEAGKQDLMANGMTFLWLDKMAIP